MHSADHCTKKEAIHPQRQPSQKSQKKVISMLFILIEDEQIKVGHLSPEEEKQHSNEIVLALKPPTVGVPFDEGSFNNEAFEYLANQP